MNLKFTYLLVFSLNIHPNRTVKFIKYCIKSRLKNKNIMCKRNVLLELVFSR